MKDTDILKNNLKLVQTLKVEISFYKKMFKIHILVLFLTGLKLIDCSDWHYANIKSNGALDGTEDWDGICKEGRRQSPVDLNHKVALAGRYAPFLFNDYDRVMIKPKIVNNGHSIQISSEDKTISVHGGGLPGSYIFEQMHFHWGSEHTIDDRRLGLELHMVHYESRFNSTTFASKEKNGIAVLGILFHIAEEDNPLVTKLLKNTGNIAETVGKVVPYIDDLRLEEYLPAKRSPYFRYEGSLTTPGCGEAVIWTVFENSLPISLEQVQKFMTIKTNDGHELTHNYRSLQPLNARALVYVTDGTESNEVYSLATKPFIAMSIFAALITIATSF